MRIGALSVLKRLTLTNHLDRWVNFLLGPSGAALLGGTEGLADGPLAASSRIVCDVPFPRGRSGPEEKQTRRDRAGHRGQQQFPQREITSDPRILGLGWMFPG